MMPQGLLKDRIRVIKQPKPDENYLTEGAKNVAESVADAAIMHREEMERRYNDLRRAFLAFEKFMRDSHGFPLK